MVLLEYTQGGVTVIHTQIIKDGPDRDDLKDGFFEGKWFPFTLEVTRWIDKSVKIEITELERDKGDHTGGKNIWGFVGTLYMDNQLSKKVGGQYDLRSCSGYIQFLEDD